MRLIRFVREGDKKDVLMAYYNGASGNVNPFSKLTDEKNLVSKDGKVYGKQFGEHVVSALADMKDVQTGAVAAKTAPLGTMLTELAGK